MSPRERDGRGLTVLQSFPVPRPTTNPYLIMLARSLREQPGVTVLPFSWRTALLGRFDVYHSHWPEILVGGRTPLRMLVRQFLVLVFLAKLTVLRIPLVRTVHNVGLPDGLNRRERALLALIDRMTTLRIVLNTETPVPDGAAVALIPHGHYRDWFAEQPRSEAIPGRLAFTGLIRRYKGVESLIAAFEAARQADPTLTLSIGGRPTGTELERTVRTAAHDRSGITATLRHLDDSELVAAVTSSELVVLPYRFMHNSGGLLAALSLDRPVLVPRNAVNEALSEEVGRGWVRFFDGELSAAALVDALASGRTAGRSASPNLSARGWERTGSAHATAYRRALALKRGHRADAEAPVRAEAQEVTP
ncbi:glycosyltransferase [Leifsonia sp. fls2-241-R2A-40a]|uniref:glycosyltransferase n=1 Tax=Leifsonia sp. fls2-241-R2A-40a TaxID=3040290 RepID=UPI00254B7E90|nr:glycosyltransferase [Leifsonia sp. fls2-241-R2A-40a]